MSKVADTATRGAWLTAVLAISAFAQLPVVVLLYLSWRNTSAHGRPGQGVTLAAMALAVATLVAVAGVWRWHRWGVFLFGLTVAAGLVIDLRTGIPPVVLLVRIALVAVLTETIRQRWDWFH
ncbi:MAG: hypothetical protein ACRD0K_20950 [Egibacteraceae bacterium]